MAAYRGTTENEDDRLAHNELALYVNDELSTKDFNKLKERFRRCPLSVQELEEITNVSELFHILEKYEKISVLNYEFFTKQLRKVNPSLATYVEKKETEGLRKMKKGAALYIFALTPDIVARSSPRKRTASSDLVMYCNEGNTKKRSTSKSYAADVHATNPPSVEHDCCVEKPSQDKYIEEIKSHTERLEQKVNEFTSKVDKYIEEIKSHIERLEQNVNKLTSKVEKFGPQKFSANPDLINFYTGFTSYDIFCSVFNVIEPTASALNMIKWTQIQGNCNINTNPSRVESLSYADQFFMFLCKIRQGFFEEDLAQRFCISQSTVIHIILTWSNYLYCILGCIPIWPTRAVVQNLLPECFKNTFPDTKVILNFTKIRVQTPSAKVLNSQTYSNYKSHTTFKGLIGITPNGAVCFVSNLYSGNISDKDITQRSGILNLLEAGDEVMIDKEFLIQDLLTPMEVKLVILPFLRSKGKLARLKTHVKREIRRCKEYRIFYQVIPMSIAGNVNQIWAVCCLLTNLPEKLF